MTPPLALCISILKTYPVNGEVDNFLNLPNFDSKSNETAYSENKNDFLKITKKLDRLVNDTKKSCLTGT